MTTINYLGNKLWKHTDEHCRILTRFEPSNDFSSVFNCFNTIYVLLPYVFIEVVLERENGETMLTSLSHYMYEHNVITLELFTSDDNECNSKNPIRYLHICDQNTDDHIIDLKTQYVKLEMDGLHIIDR
jgi:hypothetical protein